MKKVVNITLPLSFAKLASQLAFPLEKGIHWLSQAKHGQSSVRGDHSQDCLQDAS